MGNIPRVSGHMDIEEVASVGGNVVLEENIMEADISFEEYAKSRTKMSRISKGLEETGNESLYSEIFKYNNLNLINSNNDLLDFWCLNNNKFPKLSLIAKNIFAMPSTEVSVERTFSIMKYILSDQRMSIVDDLLEKLLMVIINRDYWETK